MKGASVTVIRSGEFIHEEIYLSASKSEAIKHCKKRHPEFVGNGFKIVAKNYDTEECKTHYAMCCRYGLVFSN